MNHTTRPLALVTGASSGIGAEFARELAKDGYDLALAARRVEEMQALAAELKTHGANASIFPSDLSKPGAAAGLIQEIETRGLAIDVLINNAGLGDNGRFAESDPVRIGEMLQVNIAALTELTRLVLPGMLARRRGRVLLLASTAGFQPGPKMAVYFATKAYVLSLGEAIAYELRGTDVTVTTLCPGPTATNFAAVAHAGPTRLFAGSSGSLMSAAEVARIGYQALKAGRRVVIPGVRNKFTAFLGRFAPRFLSLPFVSGLMSRRP
jgi:short-subunit dehydrogenase